LKYHKHANNQSFLWQQPAEPYRRVTVDQADQYGREGFFALRHAFSPAELTTVIAAIDPLEAETETFLKTRENGTYGIARAGEITFHPHLVKRDRVLREFAAHPVFCDLVHDLIGPEVRLYWDQSVYKKPGADREFPWHQDNGYTYVEPQQYLTCWVALTEATLDNGCPWVVPGLHLEGTLAHRSTPLGYCCLEDVEDVEDVEDAVPIELDAGSIAVFSSLTPHRTGPNATQAVRKSYILQYAADGAEFIREDADPVRCDAPDRQFFVLEGGNTP
jgi:phytanoyl-CoA hydroxylase